MDQNDSEMNFEDGGPSLDLSIPQPDAIREAPISNLNLTSWDTYMILPGDFLIKIAKKEYGNYQKWKEHVCLPSLLFVTYFSCSCSARTDF